MSVPCLSSEIGTISSGMLYPLLRLDKNESQLVYDGNPQGIHDAMDERVGQFVRGEAGHRLTEMRKRSDQMATAGT